MKYIKYFVIYLVVIIGIFYIGDLFVSSENSADKYVNEYVDTRIDKTGLTQVQGNDDEVDFIEDEITDTVSTDDTIVNTELIEADLVYVVDGDTIKVDVNGTELKVRLIGINTPESVHADESKNNDYGVMASDYTKQLLSGVDTVYLQYDESPQDQYGRELCYVWLSNRVDFDNYEDVTSYMVNAIVISEGYATTMFYKPNTRYLDYFTLCCDSAKERKIGLWQYAGFVELVK